jgi:hypothetical protein
MRICPWRSVSMRSDSFARRGSAAISVQRSRLNLVCDLRSGSSIMIGTPGRYVRNGKRHKEQNQEGCGGLRLVSGRGCRDVGSWRDRPASEWDGPRASRNLLGGFKGAVERGLWFPPGAYRAKADSKSTEWDNLQQGWYDCAKR